MHKRIHGVGSNDGCVAECPYSIILVRRIQHTTVSCLQLAWLIGKPSPCAMDDQCEVELSPLMRLEDQLNCFPGEYCRQVSLSNLSASM